MFSSQVLCFTLIVCLSHLQLSFIFSVGEFDQAAAHLVTSRVLHFSFTHGLTRTEAVMMVNTLLLFALLSAASAFHLSEQGKLQRCVRFLYNALKIFIVRGNFHFHILTCRLFAFCFLLFNYLYNIHVDNVNCFQTSFTSNHGWHRYVFFFNRTL